MRIIVILVLCWLVISASRGTTYIAEHTGENPCVTPTYCPSTSR